MQSDKIKYTAKYNKRFFTQLIFFQYYKRLSIIILTLGGILSFFLGLGYIIGWNPFEFHSFPYFTVFYAIFVALLPIYLKRKIAKKLEHHPYIEVPIHFEFSEKGIQITVDKEIKSMVWSQLYQIQSLKNTWIFYGTPHSFFYVNHDELSPADKNQLEVWLKASSKLV